MINYVKLNSMFHSAEDSTSIQGLLLDKKVYLKSCIFFINHDLNSGLLWCGPCTDHIADQYLTQDLGAVFMDSAQDKMN